MNRRLVLATGILVSSIISVRSQAYQIQYSWAGTIVPTGVSDPWLIGTQGQPFALDGVVSSDAPDLLIVETQFAAFGVTIARLVIGNQNAPYISDGVIDFTDNSNGLFDILLLGGKFQRLGETLEIESAVSLPTTTYEFSQPSESPPLFASTENVTHTACCGGTYTLLVEAGSVVMIVPEPSAALLCGTWIIIHLASQRKRFKHFHI
jgi:hypothetical protein